MASSTIATTLNFSSFSRRKSSRPIVSALSSSSSDNHSSIGFSTRTNPLQLKLDQSDVHSNPSVIENLSPSGHGVIEAKGGNPPIMPAVMTPAGAVDLSTLMFRSRIIFVGQPISAPVAERVISQLVTLATVDEESDILLYLNCPGGSVYSIIAIYDCMSWIKPKVGTVCFGTVASNATLLLAGGEKGMRYSMPNSRIMVQQPQTSCGGHVLNVRREVDEAARLRQKIDKMYAAFTGQPLEIVQRFTDRHRYMSPAEALDFGLIDGILETKY